MNTEKNKRYKLQYHILGALLGAVIGASFGYFVGGKSGAMAGLIFLGIVGEIVGVSLSNAKSKKT